MGEKFDQKAYMKAWAKANPDKVRAINAKRYLKHKARLDAQSAAYNKANPDKIKANGKAYREAHPEKIRASGAKENAAKLKRIPSWVDYHKIDMWYKAAAFATEVFGVPIEVDHIIPLKGKLVSGLHVDYNMQLLTKEANIKKFNKFEV